MSATANSTKQPYAYVAEFESASDLYHAAEKVRDAGFRKWDVHTPYPVHGMDHAMGMKKSWLSAIVLGGGLTGFLTAFVLEFFTQVKLYPTVVQNKPTNLFTVPAFFPVMFELTILFSAFATLFGLLIVLLLPRWNHPLFESELFSKFSDDGFILVIESRDPKFRVEKTRELLESAGAKSVELLEA
ncbi:MAG: DUF3341 domain-containing protein [Verrucomicrobiae bacterium]|nr:DUF3341 domain-containing protein [Verrucomicrobiae bacterium]MCP5540114.1 DUF3341 domain-containing protein [Akkermansiaceae bacterium]